VPHPIPQASNTTVAFFIKFARFEHAMNKAGYVSADRREQARADWAKLRDSVEFGALVDDLVADRSVRYLIDNPPNWLRYDARRDALEWEPYGGGQDTANAVVWAPNRVRNNLFHGDKEFDGTERDADLLNGGLRAIDMILDGIPALAQQCR